MTSKKDHAITDQVHKNLDALFGEDDDEAPDDNFPVNDNEDVQPQPVNQELDNRLDNFFENEKMPNTQNDNELNVKHEDIKNLKSVILSLEWEITDQVMQKLGEEIRILEEKRKDDKIIVAFLQLLGSLGKYIRKKRAEAHPDSIRLLHSVYESLEEIISSDTLDDSAKKKMLFTQVSEYKKLKQDIMVSKTPSSPPVQSDEGDDDAPDSTPDDKQTESQTSSAIVFRDDSENDNMSHQDIRQIAEALLNTVQEMHKTIQSEFNALREELSQRRENDRD